jgi:hypothetical protein
MPNPDLEALKADSIEMSSKQAICTILALAKQAERVPALIAELEQLRQQLATAKAVGAAEELEAIADQFKRTVFGVWTKAEIAGSLSDRAAELTKQAPK